MGDVYVRLVSETEGFLATREEWISLGKWIDEAKLNHRAWFSHLSEFFRSGRVLNTAALSSDIDEVLLVSRCAPPEVVAVLARMRRVIGRGNRKEFAVISNSEGYV